MKASMKTQLLEKSPRELLFQLALPGIIGMVVVGLYPFMDGIFAGWIIGDQGMSAISISMSLTILNGGIAALIGVGSASILSRAIGRAEKQTIDQIFGNFTYWVLVTSLLISILGIVFSPAFLDLVGAGGQIRQLGIRYLRVVFLGSLFVNFAQAGNMTMRGEGALKQSMVIMGMGALLNVILDPLFMKLMGAYAIEGAALATVLSQVVQAALTWRYFSKKSAFVGLHKVKKHKEISREMFVIGSSAMMMQLLFAVQQTLLFKQAFAYGGKEWGILMAATMRIYMFSFIPLWGMSQGLQPVIGANYGARQHQRVRETMKIFAYGASLLAAGSWIPAMFFSRKLLSIFHLQGEILDLGVINFKIFYSAFIFYGLMIMSLTFFQAIGDGKKASFLVIMRQLVLFLPAILVFPRVFGAQAVWWAQPAVDLSMILVGLLLQARVLGQMNSGLLDPGPRQGLEA